jgi:DNA (cytosine-5)-methyltransferase 1
MVSIIWKLQPDMFLFENVRGLLSARWHRERPDKVWTTVRGHFADALGSDYAIAFDLVRGYEHGVPQNRPRVLMFGLHRRHWSRFGLRRASATMMLQALRNGVACGVESGLLPPARDWRTITPHPVDILGDLVDDNWHAYVSPKEKHAGRPYPRPATTAWQRAMRSPTAWNPSRLLTEHEFSKHSLKVQRRFQEAQGQQNLQAPKHLRTKKFAQRALPAHWTTAPHITVASLPDDLIHFSTPRSFSVREWARLQGFPDWYLFRGPRTTGGHRRAGDVRCGDSVRETPMYTQIGNAVPVQLAAALGWHVRQLLGVRSNQSHGPLWDTPLSHHIRSYLSTNIG